MGLFNGLFNKKNNNDSPELAEQKENTRGEVKQSDDRPDPAAARQRQKKINNMKKKFDETVWSSVLDVMQKEIPQFVIMKKDEENPDIEKAQYVLLGFDTKIVDDFANKSDDDIGSIMTAIKSSMDCVIENGLFDNELILMIPTKRTFDALAEFEETFDLKFMIAYASDDHDISLETKTPDSNDFIVTTLPELRDMLTKGEWVGDFIKRLQNRVGSDGDFGDVDSIDSPAETDAESNDGSPEGIERESESGSESEDFGNADREEEVYYDEDETGSNTVDEVKNAVSQSVDNANNAQNKVQEQRSEIESEIKEKTEAERAREADDKPVEQPRGTTAGQSVKDKLSKLKSTVQTASDNALNDDEVKNASANINSQIRPQTFDMQAMDQYITRKYYSDDLGLEISSEPFDAMFMQTNPYVPFVEVDNDSWLSGYVNSLRRDANARLSKLHQENLMVMRERFILIITKHCESIVKSVSTDDPKSRFGYALKAISKIKSDNLAGLQESAEAYKRQKEESFQARLKTEMENGANIAKANFLNRYAKDHERELKEIETDLRNNIESEYVAAVENLKNERRAEAKRQLDAGISEALKICADEYTKILANERKEYVRLQSVITEFQNDNMAADEARIHILSEEQRRTNEVAKVHEEYDAKYELVRREFEAKLAGAKSEIEQIGLEHERYIETLKDQHEKLMQELRVSHNEELKHKDHEIALLNEQLETANGQIQTLTIKYSEQEEKIGRKYANQIDMLKSEREAWSERASHVENLHKYTDKLKLTGMVVGVVAAMGIGIIIGCAVMAGSVDKQSQNVVPYVDPASIQQGFEGVNVDFYDAETGEKLNIETEAETKSDDKVGKKSDKKTETKPETKSGTKNETKPATKANQ